MFSLLPMSLWHSASTSDSQARGSGFKYHFLQIFILNSVEFYRISLGKTRLEVFFSDNKKCKYYFQQELNFWNKRSNTLTTDTGRIQMWMMTQVPNNFFGPLCNQ